MKSPKSLRINASRLWSRLMAMGEIGATPAGGCNRQALTDLDKQGRDLFISWCRAAGCQISIDQMGNIFARRVGRDDNLPAVLTGSHLDTQPTGGKFDGVLGVLAGLEVIESLNDQDIATHHPVEVVVWTNEEGARFAPAMQGSGVFCGIFDRQTIYASQDKAGKKLGEELIRIGYQGEQPCQLKPIQAYFELHIEQGPILEANQEEIGVVTGVQGMNWYTCHLYGQAVHAGPTPMNMRQDPSKAFAQIANQLYQATDATGEAARLTLGMISTYPGVNNTVPEKLSFTLDIRHPEQTVLDQMNDTLEQTMAAVSQAGGLTYQIDYQWQSPPVIFAESCIAAVQAGCETLNYRYRRMISGAGHDAAYLAKVAPTAMIFVPCQGGISHNEAENITEAEAEKGGNVLLQAILHSAGME